MADHAPATTGPHPTTQDLLDYIAASPTPRHCVAETAFRLEAEGFSPVEEGDRWSLSEGDARYVTRQGSIVAFVVGTQPAPEAGFRLLGAHTDSPNLRVKPHADHAAEGYARVGVETYGGTLDYTWLDRDLGLAGVVVIRSEGSGGDLESHLVRVDRPILRVPSLAIHLNRDIRTDGLKLDKQKHLAPILGLAGSAEGDAAPLRRLLARELDTDADRILGWELSLMDVVPPTVGGLDDEWIFAPRLDNQAMCHAGISALLRSAGRDRTAATRVTCLYDHEEVGSGSASGAAGVFVKEILRRLAEVEGPGAEAGGLARAAARSTQVSADMAHAIHPNYADRHEPQHMPRLGGGPVIKINSQLRYATDAETASLFESLCRDAEVPCQKFVNRTDLPCGTTIGPISAALLGIRTVDVGNPMLSMHSIREQASAQDHEPMVEVMTRFLAC